MFQFRQFSCCGGTDPTLENQEAILANQQAILDRLNAGGGGGGSGDATEAKQDEILEILSTPILL